jgi:hypothetical protein
MRNGTDGGAEGIGYGSGATGELAEPERMVLWALRLLLADGDCRGLIVARLGPVCGEAEAAQVASGLGGLIDSLNRYGRRTFCLRPPGCPRLAADERCLLDLLAALQRGDRARAGAILSWLVTPDGRDAVIHYGGRVADGLQVSGRLLALVTPPCVAKRPLARARVH